MKTAVAKQFMTESHLHEGGEFCQRGQSTNLSSDVILVKKKKKWETIASQAEEAVSLSITNWPLTPGSSQVFLGSRVQSS